VKYLFIICALSFISACGATDDERWDDGNSAYERGDFAEALNIYTPFAERGLAFAQFNLGVMYDAGEGTPEDNKAAVKWYRLAAEQGHAGAQYNLGNMYSNGDGVSQNYEAAAKWWGLAAEQGVAIAQHNLGVIYDLGEGVPQDHKAATKWYRLAAEQRYADSQFNLGKRYDDGEVVAEDNEAAVAWYRLAAEQGHSVAQYNLGVMYHIGEGILQDYKAAARWTRLAAEQGEVLAQYNLGYMYDNGEVEQEDKKSAAKWYRLSAEQGYSTAQAVLGFMYAKGEGVSQDYIQARLWLNLAAVQGSKMGSQYRDIVEKKMTPAQIAEADKLASEWLAKQGAPTTDVEELIVKEASSLSEFEISIAGTDEVEISVVVSDTEGLAPGNIPTSPKALSLWGEVQSWTHRTTTDPVTGEAIHIARSPLVGLRQKAPLTFKGLTGDNALTAALSMGCLPDGSQYVGVNFNQNPQFSRGEKESGDQGYNLTVRYGKGEAHQEQFTRDPETEFFYANNPIRIGSQAILTRELRIETPIDSKADAYWRFDTTGMYDASTLLEKVCPP